MYCALGLAQVRAFSPNPDWKPVCETVFLCVSEYVLVCLWSVCE